MNNYISTFTSLSSDTLIIIVLVVALLFIGLRRSKGTLVAGIISLYISAFLYTNSFFVSSLVFVAQNPAKLFWNHLAIFVLFFVPIFLILSKIISVQNDREPLNFLKIGFLAILGGGLLLSIFYHVLPLTPVYNFSSAIDNLFASPRSYTIWLILPLIALFF